MSVFPARRIAGVAGVVLLHVAVIGALVRATYFSPPQAKIPAQEHIVWLIFHSKPPPEKPAAKASKPKEGTPAPQIAYPDYRTITLPPDLGQSDLNGIHGFLFDCSPENLGNLSPEERAQCAVASTNNDDTKAVTNQPDRSKDGVRWARALQRKQNPTLLPCMPPLSLAALLCLGKGASDGGFDLDTMPNYGDKPADVRVPNNGDPPPHPQ